MANMQLSGLTRCCTIALVFLSGSMVQAYDIGAKIERNLKGGLYIHEHIKEYNLLVKFRSKLSPNLDSRGRVLLNYNRYVELQPKVFLKYNLSFSRVIPYSKKDLEILRTPARHIPDKKGFNRFEFAGVFKVHASDSSKERLFEIGQELEKLDQVEYCSLEPKEIPAPPIDYPPTTPSFVSRQTYRGPDPGIDIDYAWTLGVRGAGLMIADMEHSWGRLDHSTQEVHEDLHNQNIKYGLPWRTDDYRDHGMAVMGLLLAGDNGYGITGSVPQARGLVYSIMHGDLNALNAAIDSAKRGDIILMEMQRSAPDGNLGPPDVISSLWDAIDEATDAGVVVVQTAGNGASNMNSTSYASYHQRGDNGSIIEGAGTADTRHTRMSYSTYGDRVNMQGWGQNVFTLGYGNGWSGSSDWKQSYSASFSGTSSSGPIVTSAVALLQSYAKERKDSLLPCPLIRTILSSTGIPQGDPQNGHIGPLPNLRAAIRMLDSLIPNTEVVKKIVSRELESKGLYVNNGTIHYLVPAASTNELQNITVFLYNMKGTLVATLVNGPQQAGQHKVTVSRATISAGTYLCAMQVKSVKHAAKVVVR
ncbi:MAG: S8 family serine peptidase [Chitinispirillaceae bacterium]|nr:S8 family serine peptidase [Chitinispirillaceae bacterium]